MLSEKILKDSILDEQIKLEDEAVHEGRVRYQRLMAEAVDRGDAPYLKPVERYRRHWLGPLTEAIRVEQEQCVNGEASTGRGTYGPVLVQPKYLEHPEVLALITIDNALSKCCQSVNGVVRRDVSYAIGREVVALLDIDAIDDPKQLAQLTGSIKRLTPQHARWWCKKHQVLSNETFKAACFIQVGECLLLHLLGTASAGSYSEGFRLAFHYYTCGDHAKGYAGRIRMKSMLRLDEEVLEEIDYGHRIRESLHPRHLPMLVQPFPWQTHDDGLVEGGYAKVRVPIISKMRRVQRHLLKGKDLTRVVDGLDAVGRTPWRVNQRVLNVVQKLYSEGGGSLGLPKSSNYDRPPHPLGFDPTKSGRAAWEGVDPQSRKLWKRDASETYALNVGLKGERETFAYRLRCLERFSSVDRFWLPPQLDFRGRCYVVPQGINYQGDDVMRGCMEYAEGRKTAGNGMKYLMIHAANCYGIDKVSFNDRVLWAGKHDSDMEAVCRDPVNNDFWRGADKPFQFLAACFALCDESSADAYLPTQWDGSCNGLQHYAALGRDPTTAALVNMVPADKPSDIYSAVAASVIDIAKGVADSSDACTKDYVGWHKGVRQVMTARQIAIMLEGHIKRSVVKQPVMTTVYGVTHIGARDQLASALEDSGLTPIQVQLASRFLTNVVMQAIGERCNSARQIMDWLRQCARLIAKDGHCVRWTSPIGFPVEQQYRRSKRIVTVLGEMVYNANGDENAAPKIGKQVNGCPPNYVHSVDAAHMMMSATACRDAGIAFTPVHDSYWTHAEDAAQLGVILREQFVALHSRDLLGELHEEWTKTFGLELPDAPQRGGYDIGDVVRSPYFFS